MLQHPNLFCIPDNGYTDLGEMKILKWFKSIFLWQLKILDLYEVFIGHFYFFFENLLFRAMVHFYLIELFVFWIFSLQVFFLLLFQDRISLCISSCPRNHSVIFPSNSQRSTCLCLPSAGIKGMCHYMAWPIAFCLFLFVCVFCFILSIC